MLRTLPEKYLNYRFDFIVFNFPCIATEVEGRDGQSEEMSINQHLLETFGHDAAILLNPDTGFLHISHKTKAAFKNWNVPKCICAKSGLVLNQMVVFDRCCYPGYINRKARDQKSFPVTDAVTFVFSLKFYDEEIQEEKIGIGLEGYIDYLKSICKRNVIPVSENLLNLIKECLLG